MMVVCGVYCIENLINHKKYVGQSVDIYHRWKDHKNALNSNRHHNAYLQRSWDKYGETNFNFYILEECDISIIDSREMYYINIFDCTNNEYGYNIESGGNSNKTISLETREKMSQAKIDVYFGGNNPKAHPVYCPQLDRTFECIADAVREGLACESSIRRCLNGIYKTAGKHPDTGEPLEWYDSKKHRESIGKNKKYNRYGTIYCIELDSVFPGGPSQASREGVAHLSCIIRCLKGERKSAGKHPITRKPLHWKQIINNNT